jgi:isopropylmalate/homocitrate/citramalate synthase
MPPVLSGEAPAADDCFSSLDAGRDVASSARHKDQALVVCEVSEVHSQPPEVTRWPLMRASWPTRAAQCVYIVDSAGALVLDQVSDRVAALVAELGDDAQVGFHGHETSASASASPIR